MAFKFCRLLFGLVSSPFGLNATVRNHIGKYEQIDPQFVREVIRSLYVDDFASGKNLLEGSIELYQKLKYRFGEGGFSMRKWASNSDKPRSTEGSNVRPKSQNKNWWTFSSTLDDFCPH